MQASLRKRQPYGSAMPMQAWSRHLPLKVVADAFAFKENFIHRACIY